MIIDKRILKCVCERETVRVLEQAREREGACENQPGIKVRLKTMGRSGVGRYNERSRGCAAVMEPRTRKPKFSERIRNKFGKLFYAGAHFFTSGPFPPPPPSSSSRLILFQPRLKYSAQVCSSDESFRSKLLIGKKVVEWLIVAR